MRLFQFDKLIGLNNRDDPTQLGPNREGVSHVQAASNVYFDNSYTAKRRPGCARIYVGTPKDLFCNKGVILFRESANLRKLNVNYTASTLTPLNTSARLAYVAVGDTIYFSSITDIGKVVNGAYLPLAIPNSNREFMAVMPPGQCIAHYRGRLYVASGNLIYVSEPYVLDVYDTRRGVLAMQGYITLLQPVEKGIFVADGSTYFMAGTEPGKFNLDAVAPYDAIPGTSLLVDAGRVKVRDMVLRDKVALWRSMKGICMGTADGTLVNLTEDRYNIASARRGGAAFVDANGMNHFIACGHN